MAGALRLGIIGCGSIARAHAAAFRQLHDDGMVEVVAVADPDPGGLDTITAITGGAPRRFADGHDLIEDPGVDAVVVITPTRFHRELIAHVAEAGKPLFTEKPLAPTFDVVREIAAIVSGAGIPCQVGFQSRFHPIIRRLRSLVESGEHGAVMGYAARDDQYWPTGEIVDGHSSWRSQREQAGGGALLEHSIHTCDRLGWCFGPARRVFAASRNVFGFGVEDTAALTIEHESGVIGNLITVFSGVVGREESRIEVFFERATVTLTTDFVVGAPEDSFMVQVAGGPPELADLDALRRADFAASGHDPDRQYWVYQYFAHHAFATAVAEQRSPSPGIADALRAHAMVEAGYRSAATGVPVALSGDLAVD